MLQKLKQAIAEMHEEDVINITIQMLESGIDPLEILDASSKAMEEIGRRFETGDCFIPELILAGEMLSQISEIIKPHLQSEVSKRSIGKIVIGTVEGDIHDIAKDIVTFMLEINGFEVTDLGVDVPTAKFVESTQETGARVVALSGFLTLAFDPMKATVKAIKGTFGNDVKIMIGGGQIDDQVKKYTGADAYGKDAIAAVNLAKQFYKSKIDDKS
jgi:methanogenic corrinoid protein MtbC1